MFQMCLYKGKVRWFLKDYILRHFLQDVRDFLKTVLFQEGCCFHKQVYQYKVKSLGLYEHNHTLLHHPR